jgi:hypothetical protein
MRRQSFDQLLQLSHELMRALGRQVGLENLERDQTVEVGLVCAEDGTECAGTDLMKNPKWSEGVGGRRSGGFRVQ